jgi:hypothetical protein
VKKHFSVLPACLLAIPITLLLFVVHSRTKWHNQNAPEVCLLTNKTNARPARCKSFDNDLLERNKDVTLTRRLLPSAEIVTLRLNEWSKKLTDRPSDRPNNKQTLH